MTLRALIVANLHFMVVLKDEAVAKAFADVGMKLNAGASRYISKMDWQTYSAGLLDMLCSDPPLSMQAVAVLHWLRQLAKKRRVAFCSGNHDKHVLIDRAFPTPNRGQSSSYVILRFSQHKGAIKV